MSCNFPLIRCETYQTYKNSSGGISYKVEWSERSLYDRPDGRRFLEMKYRRVQPIPCGQCIECRLQYAREWATRVMLEKNFCFNYNLNLGPCIPRPYPDGTCWFITVTYADEYLPQATKVNTETGEIHRGISLAKEDMQRFIKRLRYHYPQMKMKYISAGEYGGQTLRPHYHFIFFGLPLEQEQFKKIGMSPLNQPYWMLQKLTDIWGMGHVTIGRVTWESAAYVARYTLKKVKGKDKLWYNMQGMDEEFTTKSQSIGKGYFLANKDKIYTTDSVPVVNKKTGVNIKPPKSFDRILRDIDTDLYDYIKEKRKEQGITQEILKNKQTNLTPEERRAISEARMQAVMKDLRTEV